MIRRFLLSFVFVLNMTLVSFADTYNFDSVVDSQTLKLKNGEIVKLLGISSNPEFEEQAVELLKSIILSDQEVKLIFDVNQHDQEGNMQAYAYVEVVCDGDGHISTILHGQKVLHDISHTKELFINAELLKQGLVNSYTDNISDSYARLFKHLSDKAKKDKVSNTVLVHAPKEEIKESQVSSINLSANLKDVKVENERIKQLGEKINKDKDDLSLNMNTQVSVKRESLESFESLLLQKERQIEELNSRNIFLAKQIDEMSLKQRVLTDEMAGLKIDLKDTRQLKDESIETLRMSYESTIKELEDSLLNFQDEITDKEKKIKEGLAQNAVLARENKELDELNKEIKVNLLAAESLSQDSTKKIRSQLALSQKKHDAHIEELEKIINELQEENQKVHQTHKMVKDLKSELDQKEKELNRLSSDLEAKANENIALSRSMEMKDDMIRHNKERLDKSEKSLELFNERIEQEKTNNFYLTEKISRFERILSEKDEKLQQLAKIEDQYRALEDQYENLKEKYDLALNDQENVRKQASLKNMQENTIKVARSDSQNRLKIKSSVSKDQKHNIKRYYYDDGGLFIETSYNENGRLDGVKKTFSKNGRLIAMGVYEDGQLVFQKEYN